MMMSVLNELNALAFANGKDHDNSFTHDCVEPEMHMNESVVAEG